MNDPINAGAIGMGLLGGLALFLFGMEQMTDALKSFAGRGMKTLLARMTTDRIRVAFTGAFVMAVIQSFSVTTVLLVGFVSAGLMTLTQSIGVIMGANIGSVFGDLLVRSEMVPMIPLKNVHGFSILPHQINKDIQVGEPVGGIGQDENALTKHTEHSVERIDGGSSV
jgi:phosphate:Na+ symporter